jgi:thymidylate synthase
MRAYLDLLSQIRDFGLMRPSRGRLADGTRPDTQSLFAPQLAFDLSAGFPLVTTKKMGTQGFITELLWFLRGDTNIAYLHEHNCHIWDEWADVNGELGPVYGSQWRKWHAADGRVIDQIQELEKGLRENPYGRRHIITAWNVGELQKMKLPPCHMMAQFYVADDTLSCQLYQRSADMFLGVPWNIASYALLTCMLAQVLGLKRGTFVQTFGDAHIYENHFEQVDEQIKREPLELPELWLDPSITSSILDFRHEHIAIKNYRSHPALRGEVAV